MFIFRRKGWKILTLRSDGVIRSDFDGHAWKIGKWYSVRGRISTCHNGFHCSPSPRQARGFVSGQVVALVEGAGRRSFADNKTAYQHMRILRAWRYSGWNFPAFLTQGYSNNEMIALCEKNLTEIGTETDKVPSS